ncbi:MAG: PEP-CTERM sorting domain-containing protein [Phycisphaerae bacterium]|nr:PEP-CTERM sorting domain-containing protein [Phycisphaerae bacterium]
MKYSLTIALIGILLLCAGVAQAGPYAAGDATGAGAKDAGIHYTDSRFVGWVTGVVDYSPAPGVAATWTNPANVLGPVTGANTRIVSLGDLNLAQLAAWRADPVNNPGPGTITVTFDVPIANVPGAGPDFAVFENGMGSGNNVNAELAYVEVSTNGIDFARFSSVYLNYPNADLSTRTDGSIDLNGTGTKTGTGFLTQDVTNIYNLAGKHANGWGTPFDLDDLLGHELVLAGVVDLNNIRYVRLVDIPGDGSFTDSLGNPIFDAWVTTGSGGFDFAGIGVIHQQIPEPATLTLLAASAIGLIFRKKRHTT